MFVLLTLDREEPRVDRNPKYVVKQDCRTPKWLSAEKLEELYHGKGKGNDKMWEIRDLRKRIDWVSLPSLEGGHEQFDSFRSN